MIHQSKEQGDKVPSPLFSFFFSSFFLYFILFINYLEIIMIFNNLDSTLMKSALASKMQYKLGFTMIAAAKKASDVQPISFETKTPDESASIALKEAKKAFASFQEFCDTEMYTVDSLDTIILIFVASTGKPIHSSPDVVSLRSKVSGMNESKLHAAADSQRTIAIGKAEEQMLKIKAEFNDLTIYNNGFYNDERTDIEDIFTDEWVVLNYPKVVKSQCTFWSKYNNWDDAELVMMDSDQQAIDASGK